MRILEWVLAALTAMFILGAIGCLCALPLIVRQFFGVLVEEDVPTDVDGNQPPKAEDIQLEVRSAS